MTVNFDVGVYIRPWNKAFYLQLAEKSFKDANIVTISEFKGIADFWTVNSSSRNGIKTALTFDEKQDIYLRCRFLRGMGIERAFALIDNQYQCMIELFDKHDFKFFIGAIIDNYTLDIIDRICKRRSIPFISVVSHFINGYSRFSVRGELNLVNRVVEDEEVENVLDKILNPNYKPNFDLNNEKTIFECTKYFYREKIKSIAFFIKRHLQNDVNNYHYNTLGFKGLKRKQLISKNIESYFSKINEVEYNKNSIYIPLHYTPEITVDYWCDNAKDALFENSIVELIRGSSDKVHFVIKEHPAMYMKRQISFYKELLNFDNVHLIHPYESSNHLLDLVDNIYVYTGSVGVESVLRGKRVFTKTNNYYSDLTKNIHLKPYIEIEDLDLEIEEIDKFEFIKNLLSGLIPAKFINNKNLYTSDLDEIAKYIHLNYGNPN